MRDALAELPIPRQLLSALLFLVAALMAPHASNLSPAILGFFYTACAWRLLAQWHPILLPGRWVLLLLMLLALALVMLTTGLHDGRLAGTALLIVMLGLKLLELRARRDIHVTVFLGYFLVLTQFLYNQSLWLAAYLFLGVAALNVVQIGLNRVHVELGGQLRKALYMLAAALPLALVIFLLFPRLDSPLWAINTSSAVTGISGEMSLGDIGQLTSSQETAFRVRFFGKAPNPTQRYWRGPVLWKTDGRRWTAGRPPVRAARVPLPRGAPIDYELILEPTGEYWLFGLDLVTDLPAGTRLNHNLALVANQRVNKRFTYRARSDPDYRMLSLSMRERQLGLQLPDRISPRLQQLVAKWQTETDPQQPLQLVRRALAYFSEQPFVYTLSPGPLNSSDPIDEFLFDSRRGFCEHYAGSFALLMRLAGIPSRIVLGYQGGEKNPRAEHWVVRQSDAHAWTEVWIPALGWWRVDPTAAVAPERVEQSINSARSLDAGRVVFRTDSGGMIGELWREAVWLADAVDLGWHRWVVGFSTERQQSLLDSLGLGGLDGLGLTLVMLVGCGLAGGFVLLMARLPKRRARDPLPLLWRQFVDKLRHRGLAVAPWYGPDTVCKEAGLRFPEAAEQLAIINRLYVQLRYGRREDRQQIGALRRRIRQLRLD